MRWTSAVKPIGFKRYWVASNGRLHRDDGPAVEHPSGYKEWWVRGQFQYSSFLHNLGIMRDPM